MSEQESPINYAKQPFQFKIHLLAKDESKRRLRRAFREVDRSYTRGPVATRNRNGRTCSTRRAAEPKDDLLVLFPKDETFDTTSEVYNSVARYGEWMLDWSGPEP